jgi:anaerobic magnesium-protoporphyrin IX monomethyl ester cyclase
MSENLDLLIIKPGSPKKMYGDLSATLSGIEPPLMAIQTASLIREKGYSVRVIDMETEDFNAQTLAHEIARLSPVLTDIVVAGSNPSASSTPLMAITGEILGALKEKAPALKTVLTGIHPSSLPEQTLREEKTDFVAQGEGFYTILELLAALKSGSPEDGDGLKIPGLCYLKKGKFISNGWCKIVENLDELPLPAWDLLDMGKYRAHNWHCFGHLKARTPYAMIYTSFGCPYNCSYCNIHAFYDGRPGIRFRSPEKIVEEIDLLVKKYKVKNIKFLDELFAVNEERVDRVCDLLIERGYDLNIWAYARINTVNERMLEKMKKAGINWLCYGIESGSQQVRTGVDKLGFGQDQIKKVIKMTQDKGIYILGNFIFGLPDDSLETMQETFDLAKELNCEYVNFYMAMAYPGSRLYKDAKSKGLKLPDSWLGFAQLNEDTLPLDTRYVSGETVLRFRDNAFEEYFRRPEYIKLILEKFGWEEVAHIEEMLKHKIKRRFA